MAKDKKWEDFSEAKNFSEPRGLGLDKKCRLCQEPLPQVAIYDLNKIALREGFCSWSCLVSGIDSTTIAALIKKERRKKKAETKPESRQKMHSKPQGERLEPKHR